MGGQTARMLNYLLSSEIYDNNGKENSYLLGSSINGWIGKYYNDFYTS